MTVSAAAIMCVIAAAASADSGDETEANHRELSASSHGVTVPGSLGSYCLEESQADGSTVRRCVDPPYPLSTEGTLPIHPSGGVVFTHSARAQKVSVRLKSSDGLPLGEAFPARALDETGHRWIATMPAPLDPATARLGILISYSPDTDADWEISVRRHRHRPGQRKRLLVSQSGRTVRATLRKACLRPVGVEEASGCQFRRAATKTRAAQLSVDKGNPVKLLTGALARLVRVRLHPAGGSRSATVLRTQRVEDSPRRWQFRLPRRTARRGRLGIRVRFGRGEFAHFAVRVVRRP